MHGFLTGESVFEPRTSDNEKIWRLFRFSLRNHRSNLVLVQVTFFKLLDKEGQRVARSMLEQVEIGLHNSPILIIFVIRKEYSVYF